MIPFRDDNPSGSAPVVTIGLIAANVLVYLFFMLQGGRVYNAAIWQLGLIPRELWWGNLPGSAEFSPFINLFTSMFMHAGILHLAGNMLYLWIFGDNVEDYLGHIRFLFFYIACGLIAALAHVSLNLGSRVPMVGASGAIAGVLGAYLILYPRARVHVLFPLLIIFFTATIPAGFVLAFWFVLQLMNGWASLGANGPGVAYLAHIAGFVAGLLYAWRRMRSHGRPARGVLSYRNSWNR